MKRLVFGGVLLLLSVFSIGLVSAAIINFPGNGTYTSIQDAINNANDGDTVNVAAGVYDENQIVIDKPLSVIGAGASITIIDGGDATLTTNGLIRITAAGDATFSGFTIQNAGGPTNGGDDSDNKDNFAMLLDSNSSSATYTITNNKIYGRNIPADYSDFGVYASNGGKENLVFTYNTVSQTGNNNVLIERIQGSTDISYNTLDAGDWGTTAIFYMTYGGTDITTLQKVSFNTIDMSSGGSPFDADHGCSAISFSGSYRNGPSEDLGNGRYTNVKIVGNVINNLQSYRRGIALANMDPTGSEGAIINAQILNNTINGISTTETKGIRLAGLVQNADIQSNKITGVEKSFYGQDATAFAIGATDYPVGAEINYNSFSGNTNGLVWDGSTLLDAENNWWGDCKGPGIVGPGNGDNVSANVDFTPWLGACVSEKAINPSCVLETDSVTLYANVSSLVCIGDVVFSVNKNGTWQNYSGSESTVPSPGNYNASIRAFSGGSLVNWTVYADDCYGHITKDGDESFYVNRRTNLSVSGTLGLNGWYVSEPLFTLFNSDASQTFYRWGGGEAYSSSSFNLTHIPNPNKKTAGILGLNWWSNLSCGRIEPEQNQTFYIDLTNPVVENLIPAENAMVTCNPKPEISVVINDVYGSNSGINKNSILMKVDNVSVSSSVVDLNSIRVRASNISALGDGTHLVEISGADNAGNAFYKSWSFKVNMSINLNLNINMPKNQNYSSRQIQFNITTNNLAAKIEYNDSADGKLKKLCTNCNSYNKKVSFNDGLHNLTIRATDACGTVKEENVIFLIDSTLPRIISTSPRRNEIVNGSKFEVKYTEENLQGLSLVFNNTEYDMFNMSSCLSGKNQVCSIALNLSAFDGRTEEFYFSIRDPIRTVNSSKIKIRVDSSIPRLDIYFPLNNQSYIKKVPFNITISEPVKLQYQDNLGNWKTLCSGCTNYGLSSLRTIFFQPGVHEFNFKAIDSAGNSNLTSATLQVI